MSRHYGLIISVFIHVLIFLIPVSMMATQDKQNIELFMTIEDARLLQEPANMQRHPEKPVPQRKKQPAKIQPAEVSVHEERTEEIAEPVKQATQVPAEPLTVKASVPGSRMEISQDSSPPIDTEFGAAIAPSFLYREMPAYPAFARKLGKEGRVLLRLTIDERGDLIEIEVLEKAGFGFVEAAVDAVKKSTFLPAKKNGKPVASRALLPVRFLLRRDS
jgi:protein TonB